VPLHGWLSPREQLPREREKGGEGGREERERETIADYNTVEEGIRVEGNRKRERTR